MPRVSPRAVRQARLVSPLLPAILRAVPDVAAARQELRWIMRELPPSQWPQAARRRARREPLQYILGTQPFGELLIDCVPGVLIPRWETEEWCARLSACLLKQLVPPVLGPPTPSPPTPPPTISILDACTGTGCIPLLLGHSLARHGVAVSALGFDASPIAYDTSLRNLLKYRAAFPRPHPDVSFKTLDLFDPAITARLGVSPVDLVTANPPYIPLNDYHAPLLHNGVLRSVRRYEPRLALVGDLEFYTGLVENLVLPLAAKAFVFELGYLHQAKHVHQLLDNSPWSCHILYDSARNIRCVYGWNTQSDLSLESMRNYNPAP